MHYVLIGIPACIMKFRSDISKFYDFCSCVLFFINCQLISFTCLQVANGFDDCADVLLQSRADPTLKDHQGRTPVHFAALCGHFGLVETLIQHGGSPSTPDKHGYSPIHWAAYNGHDKCLEALLEVSAGWGIIACVVMWVRSKSQYLSFFLFPEGW